RITPRTTAQIMVPSIANPLSFAGTIPAPATGKPARHLTLLAAGPSRSQATPYPARTRVKRRRPLGPPHGRSLRPLGLQTHSAILLIHDEKRAGWEVGEDLGRKLHRPVTGNRGEVSAVSSLGTDAAVPDGHHPPEPRPHLQIVSHHHD